MSNRAQFKPGDFSLGQIHEFIGAFGRKDGTPDLLQRAIEDQGLMERLVRHWQSGGYESTISQKQAKAIMPKGHYFGPENWLALFGDRVVFTKAQLTKAAELPWSEEELKNPGIKQPEFVFLVPPKIDGKPVTLENLHKVFPGENHPKFHLDWYLSGQLFANKEIAFGRDSSVQLFANKEIAFGWYSVVVGIVEGSTNLSYKKQLKLLPGGYENPNATVLSTAEVLFYLLNGRYIMNTKYWARTSDTTKDDFRVCVRDWPVKGVYVDGMYDTADSGFGVAASRKFIDS